MINKIMKFLKIHFVSQCNLKDGTPLELSGDLETGVNVSVITTDGAVALPDGEYQLDDMTIIMVKDGIVMDVIEPSTPEEPTEGLDPMGNDTSKDELATQKENPVVTGDDPQPKEDPNLLTGTTTETETEVKAEDMPIEEIPTEPVVDEEDKIKILEDKISAMEAVMSEMLKKLNMISEKFSAATPIVKRKEDNESSLINPALQNKVDLINRLKKNK